MVQELKGISGGGSGLPQGGGGRRRPPPSPAPLQGGTVPTDAADLAAGTAGKARALSEALEGLQRELLTLAEGDPHREGVRQRLAKAEVSLANLLSLPPPSGAPAPERVLSLLKERP